MIKLSESERIKLVEEALKQGEELRKSKRYEEGIDLLIEALKYGVKKEQVYFRLGNIYYDAGRLEHAEYAYRRAIDHDPTHVSAHHNLSVVYKKQGRISEYVNLKKKAARLAARYPQKIQLSNEEVQRVRGFAKKFILVFLSLIGFIALIVVLINLFR
jgi:tetratricopeptide (TPR) repeat protein